MEQKLIEIKKKLYNGACYFLLRRPRTEKEVRGYLKKKSEKFTLPDDEREKIFEEIIIELKASSYINDLSYCDFFVRTKTALKPQSIKLIRFKLEKLGVVRGVLDDYFNNQEIDEVASATEALQRRSRIFALEADPRKRLQKAYGFLLRRGFSYDVAKAAVAKLDPQEYNTG